MSEAAIKLRNYMISGFFLIGRFRLKRNFTVIHFIVLSLTSATLILTPLPAGLQATLILLVMIGGIIGVFLLFWTVRAVRVTRIIGRLEKRGGSGDALRELEVEGKPYFEKADVVFGAQYGFFFSSGVVLSYRDITGLHLEGKTDRPSHTLAMPTRNILWARLSEGKWVPLAITFAFAGVRAQASVKQLKNYAAELMERNPKITWE
jgi:hypothetical protein